MKIPAKIAEAYELAKSTRLNAHAPYSGFHVGAALVGTRQIVTGCNVENASYGGTVCAERIAIFKAVSEGAATFSDIVVVTDAPEPAFPCAFCLQVMAEFFSPGVRVWLGDLGEVRSMHKFGDLLPYRFGPKQLRDANAPRAHAGAVEATAAKKLAKPSSKNKSDAKKKRRS
jgi:cytidine deaminase